MPKTMKLSQSSSKTRICPRCQSEMQGAQVEHAYWHDNILVALVQDVPCWQCSLCGYRVFERGVERSVEQIVKDYIRLGRTFPIPKTPYRAVQLS